MRGADEMTDLLKGSIERSKISEENEAREVDGTRNCSGGSTNDSVRVV